MQIQLTPAEAQAIASLIDVEVRTKGAQAAAIYGNVMRQMIEQAQAEQAAQQEEQADGND